MNLGLKLFAGTAVVDMGFGKAAADLMLLMQMKWRIDWFGQYPFIGDIILGIVAGVFGLWWLSQTLRNYGKPQKVQRYNPP